MKKKQNAEVNIAVANVRDPQARNLDIVMDLSEQPDKVFLVKDVMPTGMLELLTKESLSKLLTTIWKTENGIQHAFVRQSSWEEPISGWDWNPEEESMMDCLNDLRQDVLSKEHSMGNVIFVHIIKDEDVDRILNADA